MRLYLIYIFCVGISIYSWKDWFKGLCGLIILTAVVMHHDFPMSIVGVQGFNLWNVMLINVSLAWLINRRREGLRWDMPRKISVLLVLWLSVILFGWLLMMVDRSRLTHLRPIDLISDDLINTIKWVIPGLLLFDGCRTHRRTKMVLVSVLLVFMLFIVQIAKAIPPEAALERGNSEARMRLDSRTGLSPNGAGKMMSGVPWAMLAVIPILKTRKYRFLMIGMCVASIYTVALIGSRSGFIACFATLMLLCLIRWRRYLPLLPLVVIIVPILLPGAASRMFSGFGETNLAGEQVANKMEISSGRNEVWPIVVSKIFESPVWGFGRRAMTRTGVQQSLINRFGPYSGLAVGHPHNAYLEVLLESGLIGFVIIVGLHMRIWIYSIRLFVARGDPIYTVTGGIALALLTGHLVAHLGGQSFYPREIDICLWCAIGLMLRLYVERIRLADNMNIVTCQDAQYQGRNIVLPMPAGATYS